jgi:glucose/arabinose dehydrogenase
MRIRATLLGILAWSVGSAEGRAQSCPAIELEPVLGSGLASPLFVTHAGDATGRLFIVEQTGTIKVLQPGSNSPTVFLSIPATKLLSGGERGLLGLAFHPSFAANRRFFVYYTRQPDGASVISKYHASANDPNVADPDGSGILEFSQPFPNHNGGSMQFGPDGFLYIASGDGGSGNDPGNRAQNVNTLLGKILRIDVDTPNGAIPYSSPADNPYAGAIEGLDEIFAIGLRNPWRMSFDRSTGVLLAGDVGQGAREEVSLIELGGNYGWRVMEGTRCNIATDPLPCNSPAFTPPVFEYAHAAGRCSITGGYVYRGETGALPDGTYVFGDYCTGEIFGVGVDELPWIPRVLLDTPLLLSSFGEDEDGELYAVNHNGQVHRLLASVRIAPSSAAFDELGGDGSVAVTSPAGCGTWTAVANDPWIAVTSGGSGTGNGAVQFSVEANLETSPRTGALTVAGRTFTVDQAGASTLLVGIDDVHATEGPGAQAVFTVSLSRPSLGTVTVQLSTEDGTATGGDYVRVALDTLDFDPGETAKPVVIDLVDDSVDEDPETFFVNLSAATGGAAIGDSQGAATIADDDPSPALSIEDKSFPEGFLLRPVPFLVTLSEPSERSVSVDYVVGPGSATPGEEFRPDAGTLTFPPGMTRQRIVVWTRGDRASEGDETFVVDLQQPVNATIATPRATGTILDDDGAPGR